MVESFECTLHVFKIQRKNYNIVYWPMITLNNTILLPTLVNIVCALHGKLFTRSAKNNKIVTMSST